MICPNCGKEYIGGLCLNCGYSDQNSQIPSQQPIPSYPTTGGRSTTSQPIQGYQSQPVNYEQTHPNQQPITVNIQAPTPIQPQIIQEPAPKAKSGLTFGVLSLVFAFIPVVNIIFLVLGLVFSISSISSKKESSKRAVVGLVLSITSLLLVLILSATILVPAMVTYLEKANAYTAQSDCRAAYSTACAAFTTIQTGNDPITSPIIADLPGTPLFDETVKILDSSFDEDKLSISADPNGIISVTYDGWTYDAMTGKITETNW